MQLTSVLKSGLIYQAQWLNTSYRCEDSALSSILLAQLFYLTMITYNSQTNDIINQPLLLRLHHLWSHQLPAGITTYIYRIILDLPNYPWYVLIHYCTLKYQVFKSNVRNLWNTYICGKWKVPQESHTRSHFVLNNFRLIENGLI